MRLTLSPNALGLKNISYNYGSLIIELEPKCDVEEIRRHFTGLTLKFEKNYIEFLSSSYEDIIKLSIILVGSKLIPVDRDGNELKNLIMHLMLPELRKNKSLVNLLCKLIGPDIHLWDSEPWLAIVELVLQGNPDATLFFQSKLEFHRNQFLSKKEEIIAFIKEFGIDTFFREATLQSHPYGLEYLSEISDDNTNDTIKFLKQLYALNIMHLYQIERLSDRNSQPFRHVAYASEIMYQVYESLAQACDNPQISARLSEKAKEYVTKYARLFRDRNVVATDASGKSLTDLMDQIDSANFKAADYLKENCQTFPDAKQVDGLYGYTSGLFSHAMGSVSAEIGKVNDKTSFSNQDIKPGSPFSRFSLA